MLHANDLNRDCGMAVEADDNYDILIVGGTLAVFAVRFKI